MVTLQVFRAGRGPEDSAAQAVFSEKVKGGIVSAKWSYRANRRELPPEENPKFIFTAHSAWCNWEQSSNTLEVVVERPEIRKAEWQDSEGKRVSKGCVGRAVKLHAETKDIGEGEGVTFTVYDKYKRGVYSVGAHVAKGIAEAEWTYQYTGEKLTEKPKFTFAVTGQRCKILESPEIEMGARIRLYLKNEIEYAVYGFEVSLIKDGDTDKAELISFDKGKIEKEDFIPGLYTYSLVQKNTKLDSCSDDISNESKVTVVSYTKATSAIFELDLEKKNVILISKNDRGVSN